MNTDTVRELASQLEAQARQLRSIDTAIERIIADLGRQWKGPDFARFEGWWRNEHRPRLHRLVNAVEGLARSARNNAADQDRVSSTNPNATGAVAASGGPSTGSGGLSISRLREFSMDLLTIGGASGAIHGLAERRDLLDRVGSWMRVGEIPGALGDAVGLVDAVRRIDAAGDAGDVEGVIRASTDVAWVGASRIPVVGAVKGAWDIGWMIGDGIYEVGEVTGVNDWFADSVIDQAIRSHGGTVPDDIATRYDGVDGFGRYVVDSGGAVLNTLKFW